MKFSSRILLTLSALAGVATGCSEATQPEGVPTPPIPVAPTPISGFGIYVANSSGGDPRLIAPGSSVAWSPDGSKIAYVDGGIFIVNADGSAQRRLRKVDSDRSLDPHWSPDGSKLAFTYVNGCEDGVCDSNISVINADGTNETQLVRDADAAKLTGWSPDGKQIAFVGGKEPGADLYIINADGTNRTRLTETGFIAGADWSPDGSRIALHATWAVYVMNADGSGLTQLTTVEAGFLFVDRAVWSPRGDRIAFSVQEQGCPFDCPGPTTPAAVHVINPDGTNRITLASPGYGPHWLPDGRTLSFSKFGRGIWTVPADGGTPSLIIPDGYSHAWSPDGTRIAYVR